MNWKWTDIGRVVAYRILEDGSCESRAGSAVPEGIMPDDPDPPRVFTPAELQIEADARLNNDKLARLLFEINFDQENRLRTLQGQGAITRAQYLGALKATYAGL